ncbi:MAG: HAMP domain-containing protein, partial [Bdellovibrionales bacterium]|nr:HAMP domain-containing protein [Bdellovibrionales bacterium]
MKQKPLFWQLFPAFLILIFSSLLAFFLLAYRPFNQHLLAQAQNSLQNQLEVAKQSILNIPNVNVDKLNALFKSWDANTQLRLTLIDSDGRVLIDTKKDPAVMESHKNRPEILAALTTGQGFSIRNSKTLGRELMYAAVLLNHRSNEKWVLRASLSMENIKSQVYAIYAKLFIAGGFILGFVALLSFWLSRKVSRPLESMKQQAEQMANGDFTGRVVLKKNDPDEVYKLGLAMNEIAIQLDHRIETILNQKNERDAILASMVEGVLAVDPEQFIVHLNKAAAAILGVNRVQAVGMSIHEAIHMPEFIEIIQQSLKRELPQELDIVLNIKDKELI